MFSYLRQPKGFYKRVLLLSLPVVLQNLITTSLGFMDTFMVGLLGSEEMSAVTVANTPVFIMQLLLFGLQSGSGVLISQYWGKNDRESITPRPPRMGRAFPRNAEHCNAGYSSHPA